MKIIGDAPGWGAPIPFPATTGLITSFQSLVLQGGRADDTLSGTVGNDTYIFGRGYGHDTIRNEDPDGSGADVLVFANDIHAADIRPNRLGDDLVLSVGDGNDGVTIAGYFAGDASSGAVVDAIRVPADGCLDTLLGGFAEGVAWDMRKAA